LSIGNKFVKYLLICAFFSFCVGCERKPFKGTRREYPQSYKIRVMLHNDCNSLIITPTSADDFYTVTAANSSEQIKKFRDKISVTSSGNKINFGNMPMQSDHLIIKSSNNIFNINGDGYRGVLHLYLDPNSNSLTAINEAQLEDYLAGVIGAEIPSYWEAETLKTQAIAARTYCLYIQKAFGLARKWDVRKTQANQVYKGISAESVQVWNAVNDTNGLVLVAKNKDDTFDIFPAYYSSVCGGHTESSQNVFGGQYYEPLMGVKCPYCKHAAKNEFYSWTYNEPNKERLFQMLTLSYPNISSIGKITKIKVKKQSDYDNFSRCTNIQILGESGKSDFLRAEDFRLAIDPSGMKIKSACFIISDENDIMSFLNGTGFGHGVGLCQSGAQELARKGNNYKEILKYYYPGSMIKNIYKNE
jgi:stage II sporulation protein D